MKMSDIKRLPLYELNGYYIDIKDWIGTSINSLTEKRNMFYKSDNIEINNLLNYLNENDYSFAQEGGKRGRLICGNIKNKNGKNMTGTELINYIKDNDNLFNKRKGKKNCYKKNGEPRDLKMWINLN